LKELGWEDGRNCRVLFRWAGGHLESFPPLVGDIVAERVDVIVANGDPAIAASQHATITIPIVGISKDMVKSGFAASMARPGGNTTGVSLLADELDPKRLELLHEAVPTAKRIGVLGDPTNLLTQPGLEHAARALDLQLLALNPRNREQLAQNLDALESARVDAANVLASSLLYAERRFIIERCNRAHIPAIYQFPQMAREGGLLGYGSDLKLAYRQVADLVARLLRGARPENLPVEQPARIELVVNLGTAKAIGLSVPPSILLRADEVIE
jgi:putative tryptophan/tyrosine transport system substrate-binding protein